MTSFRTSPFRSSFTRMTRQGISEDEGAEKPPGSWKYTARHAPSWRENLMPLHFLLKLAASCMSATPPPGSSAVIGMVRTQLRGLPGSFLKSVILEGDQTPSQGPRAEEASWVHRTVFPERRRRFFFTDIQRGRFLHLFRPLITEGDPVVEDTGSEPEGGVLPGNHVFIEADGRGGVFAPRLEGVANVILHFFHIPSRDASGEVFPFTTTPSPDGSRIVLPPFSENGRPGCPRGASRTAARPEIAGMRAFPPPVRRRSGGILPYC